VPLFPNPEITLEQELLDLDMQERLSQNLDFRSILEYQSADNLFYGSFP
jgi:hypothetical protein